MYYSQLPLLTNLLINHVLLNFELYIGYTCNTNNPSCLFCIASVERTLVHFAMSEIAVIHIHRADVVYTSSKLAPNNTLRPIPPHLESLFMQLLSNNVECYYE